jgi:hypothetical protein
VIYYFNIRASFCAKSGQTGVSGKPVSFWTAWNFR